MSVLLDLYHLLFAGMCTSNTLPGVEYKGNYMPAVDYVTTLSILEIKQLIIIPSIYLISISSLTAQ